MQQQNVLGAELHISWAPIAKIFKYLVWLWMYGSAATFKAEHEASAGVRKTAFLSMAIGDWLQKWVDHSSPSNKNGQISSRKKYIYWCPRESFFILLV